MSLCQGNPVDDAHLRQKLARLKVMPDLPEYPRMAVRRTPDHYRVDPVPVEIFLRLLRRIYVPVSDYRNMHPGILPDLSDQCPVRLSGVHLAAGASVDGQSLDTDILQPFGEFHDDLRIFVPAQAGLHRHRQLHRLDHLARDLDHLVRFAHHSRSRAAPCDLVYGTSEINVHKVGTMASGDFGGPFGHHSRIHHRLRNVTVYLYSDGGLIIVGHEFFERLACVADQPVRGNEFRIHHVRPEFLADEPEGRVCHVLHRRKKKRPVS